MPDDPQSLRLDESDREELEQIGDQHDAYLQELKEQQKIHSQTPGVSEVDALLNLAWRGYWAGVLGTALGGAVPATFIFPCVGTLLAFFTFGFVAIFLALFAAILYVLLRGRLSVLNAMTWAGAMSGCLVVEDQIGAGHVDDVLGWLAMTLAGLSGGVGARVMVRRSLRKYKRVEGRGSRIWWRFELKDLLIQTTFIAVVVAMLKLSGLLYWLGAISLAAGVSVLITLQLAIFDQVVGVLPDKCKTQTQS
ncbi:hypothetical protein [Aeoliella mucimassa]|uniref:Uncharacterized protein n=1 Tax=Aeoliella mucimassa TaxID=2527972 RepID=A0A518AU94_9BACT|nr:hypothetical protein [Aeoliella mucimassa]QDU58299.1 hypothetical protein Pan181_45320 [Aeoliella mucimassa]